MKKCWKKAIAFGLALSMLASCVVVSAEEIEANGNGITVIEEAVYDEAVSFSNSVVLVENGHWQDCIKDETTGEEVPVTDVTEDTNIVFIDDAGNKKVIKNKDANGGKMFDSVGLAYTRWDNYLCEYIYVFRGTDRAYISAEGDIFGEALEFYKDIKYINDDYLFVSKDGQTYELINKAGDVLYNIAGCDSAYFINGYFYIKTDESLVIIKEAGMEVVKEYHNINYFGVLNDNYTYVSKEEKIIVLNSNAEEVLTDYVIEYCNAVEYSPSHLIIGAKLEDETKHFLMNMDSGSAVVQFKSEPKVYSDGFILDSDGGIFTNIEGTVNVDLNSYTEQILGNGDGNYAGQASYYYDNGILYHSVHRPEEDSSITYIISTKDGYQTTELIKVKGLITAIDKEKERYVLKSSSSKIYGLYNLSGKLIKDFGEYTEYSYETSGHLFSFSDSILTNAYITVNGMSNNVFIKTDGSIVGQYETVKEHGGFIFGGTGDGKLEVLNSTGEIVFSEAGLYEPKPSDSPSYAISFIRNAYGLETLDYFTIIRDGVCSLYDNNGNKIEVGNNYSAIGPCGMIKGLCKVGENDYIGYEYENYATANGLCVTRKTDAEGNHKYGVIKFPESEISGTPENTPEPTNTPVPTPEPDYEKGDIDASGSIDAKDALMVLRQSAKISTLSEKQMVAADVDDSSSVNATDALYILKYAAKLIVRFVFDSEENIAVLKEYIKGNGVVNEAGNKEIVMDYVALGDSSASLEYDSLEYDAINDNIIYVYEREHEYPENCMKFTIAFKNRKFSYVTIEWKDVVGSDVLELVCESTIANDKLTLDTDFSKDLTDIYLDGIAANFGEQKSEIWKSDAKKTYNGLVHSAFVSMEDYFSKTLIMYLPDIYESYKYNDAKLEEIQFPTYRGSAEIHDNLLKLSDTLVANGTQSEVLSFFKESYEGGSEFGTDYYDTYVEYNSEFQDVYFVLDMYHANKDTPIIVYIQPYSTRDVFVDVVIYKANSNGEYEPSKEFQGITTSMDMSASATYDFECVYPEAYSITESEQKMVEYDVNLLLESVNKLLKQKTSLKLKSFGFINY